MSAVPADVPVERDIAFDMAKRALPLAPLALLLAAVLRGGDGAVAALVAFGLIVLNLVLAAVSLAWGAARGPAALMGAALGGFAVRMALVTALLFAVRHEPWIDLPTLAVTILVSHLALLVWEMRYVSTTLAFPGLRPEVKEVKEDAR